MGIFSSLTKLLISANFLMDVSKSDLAFDLTVPRFREQCNALKEEEKNYN